MKQLILKSDEVVSTIAKLGLRIKDRFPQSDLAEVCDRLHDRAKVTGSTVEWISRPNYFMRTAIVLVIAALLLVLAYSISQFDFQTTTLTVADFVQITEAALNEIVLIGAGIIFLVTFETRRKRKRVIKAANTLRSLAHIIDAHQLTKDPDRNTTISIPTEHSPKHELTDYELGRYLDYCTEMLSLTAKLGFLYVQNFDDPVANDAVNNLETLTTGMARKIWQKIIILISRK